MLFQATDRKTGGRRVSVSQGCIPSKESYWAQSQSFLPPHCPLRVPRLSVSPSSSAGDCVLSVAVRRALSLPSSVILSPVALLVVVSMTRFYLGCCQSDWCGEVTLWQVLPCLSVESGVMVRGDWPREGEGRAERSLGGLRLHTGEVAGGSTDSSPGMCSGLGPWDSHSLHALYKTGAFKNCGWEVVSPLGLLGPRGNHFLNYAFIEAI